MKVTMQFITLQISMQLPNASNNSNLKRYCTYAVIQILKIVTSYQEAKIGFVIQGLLVLTSRGHSMTLESYGHLSL